MSLLEFESGPCKIRRVHGSFLYIDRDKPSERMRSVAVEVPAYDVMYTESLDEYVHAKTFDHIFSAFELIPDGTGRAWQFRYRPIQPPRKSVQDTPEQKQDLVLGILPDEGGVAGLVPRLSYVDENNTLAPTPGSQIIIRRDGMEAPYFVTIENMLGLLHYNQHFQRYEFGAIKSSEVLPLACFRLEKLIDMTNPSVTAPLAFVSYPPQPSILVLPPDGITAAVFEQQHLGDIQTAKRRRLPIERVLQPPLKEPPEPTSYRFHFAVLAVSVLLITIYVAISKCELTTPRTNHKHKRTSHKHKSKKNYT